LFPGIPRLCFWRINKGVDGRDKPGHDERKIRSAIAPSSHQQIDQMRDQRNIRRRHRVVAQFVGADPGEFLALARDSPRRPSAGRCKAGISRWEIIVGVTGKGQRREAGFADGDADFLVQFADQRRFRPLAGLDLAAGKFP